MVDRSAYQAAVRRALDEVRPHVEAGDSKALFRAVYLCGRARLVMPDWLVAPLERGLAKVEHFEVRSWDEAFGAPKLPQGKHLDSLRTDQLRDDVYNLVETYRLVDPGRPIDNALFDEVGARFGLKRSKASALYYKAKRQRGSRPVLLRTATKN